jgi:hypothetical protein
LVASVLPAPLSPEMMMDWLMRSPRMDWNAAAAVWKTWGTLISPRGRLRCSFMRSTVYSVSMDLNGLMDTRMVPMLV